jgi:hypothetical protein
METKRASRQTCSEKCSKQHYRAQQRKQQETHLHKTKEETPVMKESQLFQPSAAHLKRLQDIEVDFYKDRTQCNIQGREQLGIMEEFEVQGLQQALDRYAELTTVQGYQATGEIAHLPKLIAGPTVDWVVLSLRKPESQVEQEIAQIKAKVESDYLAQLAEAKAACVAKEVESLIANERRKKQQAELDAKATQEAEEYARVEAEVLTALGGKQ